ncbi:MAG: dihydrodipicolinate synthase family protein [Actinomycetia bacterium]|nr:dihydrodipicolinate synthase family protein [Actinomycetes bacterium]
MQFAGIIPPMVTPFTASEDIDEAALRDEVEYLLAAGVHGLCVTGSTGEGATLTAAETRRVAQIVVDQVRDRCPVICGIIQNSTRVVVEYARAVQDTGVAGLQITPVHYLFPPDADATVAYYRTVADTVRLPIMIYNVIPWAAVAPPVLLRVLREVPLVVGVKQSGGDMHKLADLLAHAQAEDIIMTAIDDLLYPSFLLGARGAIAGILTVLPRHSVRLWDAVREGRHDEALELHHQLLAVWRAVEGPNMPARIKYALGLQGRRGGVARQPVGAVDAGTAETIRRALRAADVPLV